MSEAYTPEEARDLLRESIKGGNCAEWRKLATESLISHHIDATEEIAYQKVEISRIRRSAKRILESVDNYLAGGGYNPALFKEWGVQHLFDNLERCRKEMMMAQETISKNGETIRKQEQEIQELRDALIAQAKLISGKSAS